MNLNIDKELAQQIVNTVKDVCGHDINFIDRSGIILASTDDRRIGTFHEIGQKAAATQSVIEVDSETLYTGTHCGVNLPVFYDHTFIAVVGISGPPDEVRKYAYLAERITLLLIREKELNAYSRTQEEKKNYILHALINQEALDPEYLDQVLSEWGIKKSSAKRLLIIRPKSARETKNLFVTEREILLFCQLTETRLYTRSYPNEYLAVVEDTVFCAKAGIIQKFADTHQELLEMGVGKTSTVYCLKESFVSARIALKSLESSEKNYAVFDTLTLEIILSALDTNSKEEYQRKIISRLEPEDLELLSAYFEEDASLTNTCRRLFLHKNTLQYKLDAIHRKCGYNPRKFRDGVLLYLAVRLS